MVVGAGYDEQFTYEKLCYASACLREIPNCLFVATNLDNADHIGDEMAVSMHLLHAHVQQCASFSSAAAGNWIKALASLCACCSSSVLLAFGMCGQHCKACCNMVFGFKHDVSQAILPLNNCPARNPGCFQSQAYRAASKSMICCVLP